MIPQIKPICWLVGVLPLFTPLSSLADYKADIGFSDLQAQMAGALPTGATVKVTHVEAPVNDVSGGAPPLYMPDPHDSQFTGKTINPPLGNPSGGYSSHATGVGYLFYGNNSSVAPGIIDIATYETNAWLNRLMTDSGSASVFPGRIANHSWVGNGNSPAATGILLRLVDRQVERNEYIQVVGINNSNGTALLGSAYNVIAVGTTNSSQPHGSVAVDGIYQAGRTRPDVVAPLEVTSTATPVISAAAALLVQTGHDGAAALSSGSTFIAGVGTIYNAERATTVKAALMAGAERVTHNTSTTANITDYRANGFQTSNGLDSRYGAGQINILNSYRIIAAGEQNSIQDEAGGHGAIGSSGFDFDESFGGAGGGNRAGSYFFTAGTDTTLRASLVWNMNVSNNNALTTTLHHLDLAILDLTNNTIAGASNSAIDNSQNVWLNLMNGHDYELRVTAAETANFSGSYALAWQIDATPAPVPVPAAVWLLSSSLLAGATLIRVRRQ